MTARITASSGGSYAAFDGTAQDTDAVDFREETNTLAWVYEEVVSSGLHGYALPNGEYLFWEQGMIKGRAARASGGWHPGACLQASPGPHPSHSRPRLSQVGRVSSQAGDGVLSTVLGTFLGCA